LNKTFNLISRTLTTSIIIIKEKLLKKMFKYYVIHNLEKYRKDRITSALVNNGVDMDDVKFINYPNKRDLTYKIKKESVQKGIKIADGWIAVSYKHYLALKDIVENSYPYGVIIEDNVADFKDIIPNRLNLYLEQLPENWDIVYDSDWISYQEIFEEKVIPQKVVYKKSNEITQNENDEIIVHGGTKSAQFYMVNLNSAKKLFDNFLPFNHAPDMWMNELFRKLDINSFWAEPTFIVSYHSNEELRKIHVSSASTKTFLNKISFSNLKSKIINKIVGIRDF